MGYKLVIFDFDGTLADSFPWFLDAFNEAADTFAFRPIRRNELDLVRGYGSRRILAHFGVPRWKLPRIASHMRRLAARDLRRIRLFHGAERMIQELAEGGIELAIASSNSEETVRAVLGPRNAARITHFACGASLFGKPAKFRRIVRVSKLSPEDVLCIGDEGRDAEAARRERLAFGAVSWGYALPEALEALRPEHSFTSMEQVVATLLPATQPIESQA